MNDDLVHAFKFLVHSNRGNKAQAFSELRKIENYFDLPEWDDVDYLTKIEVYTEGWRQLREEGYDDQGNATNLLGDNESGN